MYTEPPPPPQPTAQPPVLEPQSAEEPPPAPTTEAERYAVLYPERAALIRRAGQVPHDVTFGPIDDDLLQELLAARGPIFTRLDRRFAPSPP